ncbi:MAG: TAXI family TRAP transporter solute-binding subunit [Betaproteobacteria bacterium]
MPKTPRRAATPDDFTLEIDDLLSRVSESARQTLGTAREREGFDVPEPQPPVPYDFVDTTPDFPSFDEHPGPRALAEQSFGPTSFATTPDDAPAAPAARRGPALAGRGALVALALLAVAGAGWWGTRPSSSPVPQQAAAALEALPPPAAGHVVQQAVAAPQGTSTALAPPPAIHVVVAIDQDASTEARMAEELHRAIAAGAPPGGVGRFDAKAVFEITRYDAIGALPDTSRIVSTLGIEEVYALVPAASPLRHLGELRGRRINIGPRGSARAVSGAALYRTMFAGAPPASAQAALPRDAALARLLQGRDLDALLLFDGQPSGWLASLPEPTRRGLRVLVLDPADAAGRRALQHYLPAAIAPGAGQQGGAALPTLAELTFLVSSAPTPDAAAMLRTLCDGLPALRAQGHPKWREVDPALRLPVGPQRPAELDAVLATCAAPVR